MVPVAPSILTSSRLRFYGGTLLVISFVLVCLRLVPLAYFPGADGMVSPGDLVPRLVAARLILARAGPGLYDVNRQKDTVLAILDVQKTTYLEPFLSPAFVGLLYVPLVALPYKSAILIWSTVTAFLSLAGLWLLRPFTPLRWSGLLFAASWPAVLLVLDFQDSAIALVILVAGLRLLLAKHDAWAGAILALGLYKPQLFLLIPVVLLCQRRYRALASFAVCALLLGFLTLALIGLDGMSAWYRLLTSTIVAQLVMDISWNQISLAAFARGLIGVSVYLPLVVVLLGVVPTLLFLHFASNLPPDPITLTHLFGLAVVVGLLVTPYSFVYDGVILTIPVVLSIRAITESRAAKWSLVAAYLLLWTNLPRHLFFVQFASPLAILGAALAPLALAVFAIALARALARRHSPLELAAPVSYLVQERYA